MAVSAPVNALAPFTFEVKRPRYLVMAAAEAAPVVNTVGDPDEVEIALYGPAAAVASFNAKIAGWAKFALTKALTVPVVVVKLEKEGVIR